MFLTSESMHVRFLTSFAPTNSLRAPRPKRSHLDIPQGVVGTDGLYVDGTSHATVALSQSTLSTIKWPSSGLHFAQQQGKSKQSRAFPNWGVHED